MKQDLRQLISQKVVIFDGAMGTSLQNQSLTPDDFQGLDGCNEILTLSKPAAVSTVHEEFIRAGADVVETNTFGANGVVLAEYGIAHRTYELAKRSAELARVVASDHSTPDRPRFVCGSVGPGTKLPSLGHITYRDLKTAYLPQMEGLLDGGVDAVCIETCQDLLQAKAVLDALREAQSSRTVDFLLLLSLTIETTGTMLVGSDIAAAVAALMPLGPDVMGLNCATGPELMKRHVQYLGRHGTEVISVMPNAGLPKNVGGEPVYPLTAEEFADWHAAFVEEDGVGIVGGCCGTTPAHIEAAAAKLDGAAAPKRRRTRSPETASLYNAVTMTQTPAPLIVGERTNANGSKEFREKLLADDLDGMVAVAREQERGGAHLLDVCVAYVGRDERADMTRLIPELARQVKMPLMIDSTDPKTIEAALERHGGRCVINSINLEDGRDRLDHIVGLAGRFGAALVALVIDEEGMALTCQRKLAVAERIYRICTEEHGMAPEDLIFDMLTFTVASGDPETRSAALETLEAIETLKARYAGVHTILGVSNVSFGLKPAARRNLNSVFLAEAITRGLDQAIINARGIIPLNRIPDKLKDICRRLLFDDRSEGDPLVELLDAFADQTAGISGEAVVEDLSPVERIRKAVIDGEKQGLAELLDQLLETGRAPLDLVNGELIPAMKVVGELFGSGQMQLPFVLQSAEVMKTAVKHLEPHMENIEATRKGTIVLATVRGDVHDIGKNLVDIILSNNGFQVINLGIKIGIEQMLDAAGEHDADAIGMSGLLVKSTVVMKENLEEMVRRGVRLPVLLGGAALTRDYVERNLRDVYGPEVHYGEDAFAALRILGEAGEAQTDPDTDPLSRPRSESSKAISTDPPRLAGEPEFVGTPGTAGGAPGTGGPADRYDGADHQLPAVEIDMAVPVPDPPFLGTRIIDAIPLDELFLLLNETTLFRGQWRYRRGAMSREQFHKMIEREVRPAFEELKTRCLEENILLPRAVQGYFRCYRAGQDVVIADANDSSELTRFSFPRRRSEPHHCVADYFRPKPVSPAESGMESPDLIGLFVVTVGEEASQKEKELFEAGSYVDYLHLHGLAVETAEAAAEWLHARMRRELGIAGDDMEGVQAMVRQGYRGSRYSFGYPSCPDLSLQERLFDLLRPRRIGVRLSESFQMIPEQSVSAIVVHHPEAKYFDLG